MNYRFFTWLTLGLLFYSIYNLSVVVNSAAVWGCAVDLVTLCLLAVSKAAEKNGENNETHLE